MTSKLINQIASEKGGKTKRILMTGARAPTALDLARHLKSAGHHVIAADTSAMHVLRFSNAISKFIVIPSPRFEQDKFIDTLVRIVEEEKIDIVIPIWEEVIYLSCHLHRFPKSCEVFCSPFELIHELHHKWLFIKKLESLGIPAPKTFLIESLEDLKHVDFKSPFIMKGCYSRGSRKVMVVKPGEIPNITFEKGNPWIAQQLIEGTKYCSYSVCYKGKLQAHTAYPVQYTMDGSSCLAFESMDHPKIYAWVKNLVELTGFTGHAAFDFIETKDGVLYAIECNARATSGLHLFKDEDHVSRAFVNDTAKTIVPKPGNSKQIATGMLCYGWKIAARENQRAKYVKKFFTTQDVVFSTKDLKPFLFEPLVFTSYWLKSRIKGLSIPVHFTQDLDWDESR